MSLVDVGPGCRRRRWTLLSLPKQPRLVSVRHMLYGGAVNDHVHVQYTPERQRVDAEHQSVREQPANWQVLQPGQVLPLRLLMDRETNS